MHRATIRQVAADLGINPETLHNWIRDAGASRPRGHRAEVSAEPPTSLEAENAALRAPAAAQVSFKVSCRPCCCKYAVHSRAVGHPALVLIVAQ
ncbi:transposase [Streptomyces sp. NPDC001156]